MDAMIPFTPAGVRIYGLLYPQLFSPLVWVGAG